MLIGLDCLIDLAAAVKCVAEIVPGFGEMLPQRQRPSNAHDSVVQSSVIAQSDAKIVMQLRHALSTTDCLLVRRDRFERFTILPKSRAKIAQCFGKIGA